MTARRKPAALPPPTMRERADAAIAARAIRASIATPAAAGEKGTMHVNTGRRRAHLWLRTWEGVPGLMLDLRRRVYSHTLLPGWEYTVREMKTEMIEDLEQLAERGVRPTEATR